MQLLKSIRPSVHIKKLMKVEGIVPQFNMNRTKVFGQVKILVWNLKNPSLLATIHKKKWFITIYLRKEYFGLVTSVARCK
jgi:hypothetical protein